MDIVAHLTYDCSDFDEYIFRLESQGKVGALGKLAPSFASYNFMIQIEANSQPFGDYLFIKKSLQRKLKLPSM